MMMIYTTSTAIFIFGLGLSISLLIVTIVYSIIFGFMNGDILVGDGNNYPGLLI
jgi:hypothetical protein